jgi:hypothetical protein
MASMCRVMCRTTFYACSTIDDVNVNAQGSAVAPTLSECHLK